jgi:hypothetical protein
VTPIEEITGCKTNEAVCDPGHEEEGETTGHNATELAETGPGCHLFNSSIRVSAIIMENFESISDSWSGLLSVAFAASVM